MARKEKQPVHKVVMTEGKRNIIRGLLEEYDIQDAHDIQEALKDLLGGTIKEMMEAEMEDHLGYRKSERSDQDNYRNGYKSKRVNSSYGNMEIDVPQDRNSTFEPRVVKKRQKDISEIIHYSVRDNGMIRKLAAYVILGLTLEGKKEVLSIQIGENETSKYWLSVLNELKKRGVKDILILCSDGLSGIKEAIAAAFPETEQHRCIVHMVRNTLKYVSDKDRKAFAADLKTIYHAPNEEKAREASEKVMAKWTPKYPNSMKCWQDNWDVISPIFKFSMGVRKVIYTTNAIESLNSTYRKLNRQRSVFPSDTALLKALYLATFEATKKWTMPVRNWGQVYGELSIMYEGRLPE